MAGIKHDGEKAPIDLVPEEYVLAAARAFSYGAKKYSEHNWREGMPSNRLYAALMRHLLAWNEGEQKDSESGLSHLDHAAASLAMLIATLKNKPELDSRYKSE